MDNSDIWTKVTYEQERPMDYSDLWTISWTIVTY